MCDINYSIIIPHKNSPDLLRRCLDSIPRRKDVQIIVVDDNSDSEKVDFEHFPGVGEISVEIYLTKEGKGAGYARNVGLGRAKGKWLLFADADDYYADDFLEVLDGYIESENDIIFYSVFGDADIQHDRALYIQKIYDRYFSGELSLSHFKYMIWVPWNKMFKKTLIDKYNFKFEEIPVGNDAFFSLNACEQTNRILVLKEKLYCVTYNNQSITHSNPNSFSKQLDYLSVNLRIGRFLKKHRILYYAAPFGYILKFYGLKSLICYIKYLIYEKSLFNQLAVYLKVRKFNGELVPF